MYVFYSSVKTIYFLIKWPFTNAKTYILFTGPNKFSVSANQDCLLGKSINSMKPDNLYDAPNCKAWCYNNYTCGGFVIDVSPNTYRPCLFKTNDCRNDIQDVFVFPHASFLFIIAD